MKTKATKSQGGTLPDEDRVHEPSRCSDTVRKLIEELKGIQNGSAHVWMEGVLCTIDVAISRLEQGYLPDEEITYITMVILPQYQKS